LITNEVSRTIRETDIFTRWSGEEFMILTPDTNLESAIRLAEMTRRNIEME